MKRIQLNTDHIGHIKDVEKIQKILKDADYVVDNYVVKNMWEKYSEMFAASWLILDNYTDYEILNVIEVLIQNNPEFKITEEN